MSEENKRFKMVIKNLKDNRNLTQKEIADAIGISETMLSKLKKENEIPKEQSEILHEKYNINPDYIYKNSELMYDLANEKLKKFNSLFVKWEKCEKIYTTDRKTVFKKIHKKNMCIYICIRIIMIY